MSSSWRRPATRARRQFDHYPPPVGHFSRGLRPAEAGRTRLESGSLNREIRLERAGRRHHQPGPARTNAHIRRHERRRTVCDRRDRAAVVRVSFCVVSRDQIRRHPRIRWPSSFGGSTIAGCLGSISSALGAPVRKVARDNGTRQRRLLGSERSPGAPGPPAWIHLGRRRRPGRCDQASDDTFRDTTVRRLATAGRPRSTGGSPSPGDIEGPHGSYWRNNHERTQLTYGTALEAVDNVTSRLLRRSPEAPVVLAKRPRLRAPGAGRLCLRHRPSRSALPQSLR